MTRLWRIFWDDVNSMSTKEHIWYWGFPSILLILLVVSYFSGIPFLVEIVCPAENREWGLIENIQITIILGIIGLTVYAFFARQSFLQKLGFGFLFVFSIFIFLEEIDYGAHIAQYFWGQREGLLYKLVGVTNVHNQKGSAKYYKRTVEALMGIIFVLSPFIAYRIKHPMLSYLIPQPRVLILAGLTVIADLIPRLLVNIGIFEAGPLRRDNIGEFAEIMIYYIFLVYMYQLIFVKEWKYCASD